MPASSRTHKVVGYSSEKGTGDTVLTNRHKFILLQGTSYLTVNYGKDVTPTQDCRFSLAHLDWRQSTLAY